MVARHSLFALAISQFVTLLVLLVAVLDQRSRTIRVASHLTPVMYYRSFSTRQNDAVHFGSTSHFAFM